MCVQETFLSPARPLVEALASVEIKFRPPGQLLVASAHLIKGATKCASMHWKIRIRHIRGTLSS